MPRNKNLGGEERRLRILEFIIGYIDLHKIPPTIREIKESVKIKSTSIVEWHLKKLEETGKIERDPGISRGIRVPERIRRSYLVEYRCLYPFGCLETSKSAGDCRIHGTQLVPFVERKAIR